MERLWSQNVAGMRGRAMKLGGPGLLLAVVLMILLIVPLLLIGAIALIGLACFRGARGLLSRMRQPNGVLDGRRNVRVVVRE